MTSVHIPLRWRDFDALGHVSASVYVTLFEEARDRWLQQTLGSVFDPAHYVIARIELDYKREIPLDTGFIKADHVCAAVGTKSVTLDGRLFNDADGRDYALARVVIVLWDPAQGGSRPLKPEERAALTVVLADERGDIRGRQRSS